LAGGGAIYRVPLGGPSLRTQPAWPTQISSTLHELDGPRLVWA